MLRELVETGLRHVITERRRKQPFRLRESGTPPTKGVARTLGDPVAVRPRIWTADRVFSRFPGLTAINPLVAS